MKTAARLAKKPNHRDASTVGEGHNAKGQKVAIYRRGVRYGSEDAAHAALVVLDNSRHGRAALHRIAALVEEAMGERLAPVCMETDHGGNPLLWIEGDGEDTVELHEHLAILLAAAGEAGFAA